VLATKKVADLAIELNKTSREAEEIGTTLGQKMNFRDQLGRMGRSWQESDRLLTESIKVGTEARSNYFSTMFQELDRDIKVGGIRFGQEFRDAMAAAVGEPEQFNVIVQYHEKIRDLVNERYKDRSVEERNHLTATFQRIFRERIGITENLAQIKTLHALDKDRAAFWEKMDTNSKAVAANANAAYANIKLIVAELESKAFDPKISPFVKTIEAAKDLTEDLLNLIIGKKDQPAKSGWICRGAATIREGQKEIPTPPYGFSFVPSPSQLRRPPNSSLGRTVRPKFNELALDRASRRTARDRTAPTDHQAGGTAKRRQPQRPRL
jgi:hypothetical protein